MTKIKKDRWYPVEEILAIIKDKKWIWYRNFRCKYITLRIDTRDIHASLKDRNGKEITLEELKDQG